MNVTAAMRLPLHGLDSRAAQITMIPHTIMLDYRPFFICTFMRISNTFSAVNCRNSIQKNYDDPCLRSQ